MRRRWLEAGWLEIGGGVDGWKRRWLERRRRWLESWELGDVRGLLVVGFLDKIGILKGEKIKMGWICGFVC